MEFPRYGRSDAVAASNFITKNDFEGFDTHQYETDEQLATHLSAIWGTQGDKGG